MIDPLRASDPVLFSKGDESGGKSESEADRQLGEVEAHPPENEVASVFTFCTIFNLRNTNLSPECTPLALFRNVLVGHRVIIIVGFPIG